MKFRKIILSILMTALTFSVCGCASTEESSVDETDVVEVNMGLNEAGNKVEQMTEEKDLINVTIYYADMMFTKLLQERPVGFDADGVYLKRMNDQLILKEEDFLC